MSVNNNLIPTQIQETFRKEDENFSKPEQNIPTVMEHFKSESGIANESTRELKGVLVKPSQGGDCSDIVNSLINDKELFPNSNSSRVRVSISNREEKQYDFSRLEGSLNKLICLTRTEDGRNKLLFQLLSNFVSTDEFFKRKNDSLNKELYDLTSRLSYFLNHNKNVVRYAFQKMNKEVTQCLIDNQLIDSCEEYLYFINCVEGELREELQLDLYKPLLENHQNIIKKLDSTPEVITLDSTPEDIAYEAEVEMFSIQSKIKLLSGKLNLILDREITPTVEETLELFVKYSKLMKILENESRFQKLHKMFSEIKAQMGTLFSSNSLDLENIRNIIPKWNTEQIKAYYCCVQFMKAYDRAASLDTHSVYENIISKNWMLKTALKDLREEAQFLLKNITLSKSRDDTLNELLSKFFSKIVCLKEIFQKYKEEDLFKSLEMNFFEVIIISKRIAIILDELEKKKNQEELEKTKS